MNLLSNQHNRMFTWSLNLAGVIAVALIIGGFYVLVYQPLERKQAEYAHRFEQLDELLIKMGAEGSEYRQLRDQLDEMRVLVDDVNHQLANNTSEKTLIEDLSKIASEVNLDIVDYQVGLKESTPTHSQTEVEFSCLGSYASICRFLEKAEQLAKIAKLSRFELESSKKSRQYPIQLTFVLYSEGKSNDTKEKRGVL